MKQKTGNPHVDRVYDDQHSLAEKTRQLIADDPRDYLEIYRDLGIPFHWLRTFAEGKVGGPSVNRVQYVYEQLSGEKLFK